MSLEELLRFPLVASLSNDNAEAPSGNAAHDGNDQVSPRRLQFLEAAKAIRPSRSGSNWLAVPSEASGLAYRAVPSISTTDSSPSSLTTSAALLSWHLQAIQVLEDKTLRVLFSVPVAPSATTSSTADVINLCASGDGTKVAMAWSDGSLQCYATATTGQGAELQWSVAHAHSHDISSNNNNNQSAGPVHSMFFLPGSSSQLVVANANLGLKVFSDGASGGHTSPKTTTFLSTGTSAAAAALMPSAGEATAALVLAVGDAESSDVRLYKYGTRTRQLELLQTFACPIEDDDNDDGASSFRCTHLHWISDNTLIAGYCKVVADERASDNDDGEEDDDEDDSAEHVAELCVLRFNADLSSLVSTSALGDVVPFFTVPKRGRHAFATALVPPSTHNSNNNHNRPPLVFVAANVGTDVALVGPDVASDEAYSSSSSNLDSHWRVLEIPEGQGVLTPTDKATDEFYYPTGLAVVPVQATTTASTSEDGPAVVSFVLLLSCTDGSLSLFDLRHDDDEAYFVAPASRPPSATAAAILAASPARTAAIDEAPSTPVLRDEVSQDVTAQTPPTAAAAPAVASSPASAFGSGFASPLFGSGAAAPTFESGSAPTFEIGTTTPLFGSGSAAPTFGSGTAAPVFGSPSVLGAAASSGSSPSTATTPPPSAQKPAGAVGLFGSTAFGSGASAPAFGSGSSIPTFGSGFGSLTSPSFGALSSQAAASATGTSAPSPFNLFSPAATSAAASMAKPLFGSSPSPSKAAAASTPATATSSPAKASAADSSPSKPAATAQGVNDTKVAVSPPRLASPPRTATAAATPSVGTSTAASPGRPAVVEKRSGAAKLAAQVFDMIDTEGTASLPVSKMEALLDEIGEGFHGEELDEQVAKIDVDGTGYLERSAFVAWYEKLVLGDADGDGSSASDDDSERREEEANAREAFLKLAAEDTANDAGGRRTLDASKFPDLLESMGTTYCEESHARIARKLTKNDKIEMDDFVQWYVQWVFEEALSDEDSEDESGEGEDANDSATTAGPAAAAAGWGDIFKTDETLWKCEICMVSNKDSDVKCVACETPRPGHEAVPASIAPAPAPSAPSQGFSFGIAPAPTSAAPAGGFTFGFSTAGTSNDSEPSEASAASSNKAGGFTFGFGAGATSGSETAPGCAVASNQSAPGGFTFGVAGGASSGAAAQPGAATPAPNVSSGGIVAPSTAASTKDTSAVESAPPASTDKTKTPSSSYPPTTSKAPKPFGTLSMASPTASAAPAGAPKASAYPPVVSKAPKPFSFTSSESAKGKEGKSQAYPPSASKAPEPFSLPSVAPLKSAGPGYPPLASKAPTPFGSAGSKTSSVATTLPKSDSKLAPAYPPVASKAPKPFSFSSVTQDDGRIDTDSSRVGYTSQATSTSTPSAKPGSFGRSPASEGAKAPSSIYPPATSKPPQPFSFNVAVASAPKPDTSKAAPSSATSSGYPPLGSKAPTPFGASAPTAASTQGSMSKPAASPSYPPMSSKAPQPFGSTVTAPSKGQGDRANASTQHAVSGLPARDQSSSKRFGSLPSAGTTSIGVAASAPPQAPTTTRLSEVRPTIELSETARQLVSLTRSMKDRAKMLKGAYKSELNDQYSVDAGQVNDAVRSVILGLSNTESALNSCKDRAVTVVRSKALAQRQYAQAQQLLSRLTEANGDIAGDVVRLQPLDADSEELRRQLASKAKLANVYASILQSRCLLLEEEDLPKAILGRALDTHEDVIGFRALSERAAKAVRSLESQSSTKPPTRAIIPVSSRHSRRVPARPLAWREVEEKFQILPSPEVKTIDMPSVSSLDRFTPKRESPNRMATLAEAFQSYRPPPVMSPPLSLTCRRGWDTPSTAVSSKPTFEMPRTLRETTFAEASRGALASSGIFPEKLSDVINRTRRGVPPVPGSSPSGQALASSVREGRLQKDAAEDARPLPPPSLSPKSSGTPISLSPKLDNSAFASPPASLLSSMGGKPSIEFGALKVGDNAPPKSNAAATAESSKAASFFGATTDQSKGKRGNDSHAAGMFGLGDLGSALGTAFGTALSSAESSPKPGAETRPIDVPKEPDYQAILFDFYKSHNPAKLSEVPKTLERYKGREKEMFEKLAQRYRVPNPLSAYSGTQSSSTIAAPSVPGIPTSAPSPSTFGVANPAPGPSPFSTAAPSSGQSPFGGAPSLTSSASPFGGGSGAFGGLGLASSPSPFGPTSNQPLTSAAGSAFGATMTPAPVSTPFSQGSPSPFASPPAASATVGGKPPLMIGGRNPRDILLQFYQQHNPSKVGEVDRLLAKYQGNEEQLFRNLAKRYNLDPSMFGLTSTPTLGSTPAPAAPAFGSGFGHPTPLGFAGAAPASTPFSSPFGTGSPAPAPSSFGASSFGASPLSSGFGHASAMGTGSGVASPGFGGGGTFGSASGAASAPATSFGALASSSGFGGGGGAGTPLAGFAPPSTTPSPFSAPAGAAFGSPSPFGAPRR